MMQLRDFFTRPPTDGVVADGAVLLQRDETSWTVAKGWVFEPPAGQTAQASLHALAEAALESLPLEFGFQVILSSEVDAISDLEAQHAEAPKAPTREAEEVRQSMMERLRKKRDAGTLRRLRCYVFIGTHVTDTFMGLRLCIKPTEAMVQTRLLKLVEASRPVIEQLRQSNGTLTELDDRELHRVLDQHFNSESFENLTYAQSREYSPRTTILTEHWRNEMVFSGTKSFEMGQRHYGFVLVDLLPPTLYPHAFDFLRTLDSDITVVVQVERVDSAKTVSRLERSHKHLSREQQETNNPALGDQIDSDASLARIIQSGRAHPVFLRLSFLVRAKSKEELSSKISAVNTKLKDQKFITEFPAASATLSSLFFSTMPGVVLPSYRRGFHRTLHTAAAILLPLLSSFRGHKNAHAVLEGNAGNVVALAAFEGEGQAEVPYNALLVAPKGSGKSVFLNWLLYVLSHLFVSRVIIDYSGKGTAYSRFLKTFGKHLEPIVPGGAKHKASINPIDTNKNPFTEAEFQAPLVTSISLLIGVQDNHKARAEVDKAVYELVRTHLEDWLDKKPKRALEVAKTAFAIHTLAGNDTARFLDAFYQFRNLPPQERATLIESVTAQQLTRFQCSHEGKQLIWRLAASYLEHSEWCTFSNLVNVLEFDCKQSDLATSLSSYTKGKSYGNFLDAPTNVDLNAPCVYFDLAGIGAGEVQMQRAMVSIIFLSVLSSMFNKPGRKALMIDEALTLMGFEGLEKELARAFRTLRKNSCSCYLVIHELESLKDSAASQSIITNTDIYYIFRQIAGSNLEALQKLLKLPDSVVKEIETYKAPSAQGSVEKYADVYVHPASAVHAQGGTARLYAPPIVLQMTQESEPKAKS